MKRLLLVALFALGATFTTKAQIIADNAIGLRFGGGNGVGAEVSYQRALGVANNRLEVDFGWRNDSDFDAFKLTGLYQWVWNIDKGFNWYAGVGGGVGNVNASNRNVDDGAFVFAAGNIGLEYNFDIPLLLSLDFRPEIGFADYDVRNDFSPDVALGIRYQF